MYRLTSLDQPESGIVAFNTGTNSLPGLVSNSICDELMQLE